jgi:hypothetical protein
MKILAILQNQWFKDPEGVKKMYEEHPERRNRYIEAFLFMGCLSGKRLEKAFGQELCGKIIWEEASPQIAGFASAVFPADPDHICKALIDHKPQMVLTFGKIATDGFQAALKLHPEPIKFYHLSGPHPAAKTDVIQRLNEMADRVRLLIKGQN